MLAVLPCLLCLACGDPEGDEVDVGHGNPDAASTPDADPARPGADPAAPDAAPPPDADPAAPDADLSQPDGGIVQVSGCTPLALTTNVDLGGFDAERFSWSDGECRRRTAAMVQNDHQDPTGHWGGYLRQATYDLGGGTIRTVTGSSDNHPGWGYTVNHYDDTASSSRNVQGTYSTLLEGRHHAIHEYRWTDVPIDGQDVVVTIQWMFATGRSHPLWSITYDLTGIAEGLVEADTRSPYGDLQWDGGGGHDVDGVGWGDHYKFVSLDSPVDLSSGWDYATPNTIPYVVMWVTNPDSEMGSVQTQTYEQHDAGGYWNYPNWGGRDADGPMPEDWNWTYQLNQYEIPFLLNSKRLAWGSNFGAVGKAAYPAYGDASTLVGHPYQSYSVFMVLGKHSEGAVARQVTEMERVQAATLTASVGTVRTSGPAGVRRSDTITYDPPGWNPIHATWDVTASGNRAVVTLTGNLASPTLVIHGYTAASAPVVRRGATTLVADEDYFMSFDAAGDRVWITLAGTISGSTPLTVE
jgi:hypothetical protein